MKAVVVYKSGVVRYEEYPEPKVEPGTVKVRVMACGVCGSDIPRVWNNGAHEYPIVLGHEFSGYIVEVAPDVKNASVGDHVSGVPLVPCMKCPDCAKGNYSQCKHYSFIGSRQQGAFADYIVLPANNVVKIDKSIPYINAAMFEPATVALHGININNYAGGKRVLILGGGTIGCFVLQWAKAFGAACLVVVGRDRQHLHLSEELGADYTVSTLDENYKEELKNITNREGFDYVFETAGSTSMMQLAFEMAANKANVCFIGTPKEELVFTPGLWENLNRKEMKLTGAWMSGNAPFPGSEWEITQQFMASGKICVHPRMIPQTFEMKDAKEAFGLFKNGGRVKGRVVLTNRDSDEL